MTASNLSGKWSAWAPQLRSVLRIVAAFVFIQSGTMKLFGFPMAMPGGNTAALLTEVHPLLLHLVILISRRRRAVGPGRPSAKMTGPSVDLEECRSTSN